MDYQYFILRGPLSEIDFFDKKIQLEGIFGKTTSCNEAVLYFQDKLDTRIYSNYKGLYLETRRTIDSIYNTKDIKQLFCEQNHIESVLGFLAHLGYEQGIVSEGIYYEAGGDDLKFAFRSKAQIGSFYEIFLRIPYGLNLQLINKYLKNICTILELPIWTYSSFHNLVKSVNDNKILHLKETNTVKSYFQTVNTDSKPQDPSIHQKLCVRSNNYSHLEVIFHTMTGVALLDNNSHIMLTESPKLSIIIPTYNSLHSLEYTLRSIEKSVLDSNLKNKKHIEVIVVDDGSSDKTVDKIKNISTWYDLKIFSQNNMGRSFARNIGIGMATGEIVLFLDSDVIVDAYLINDHLTRHKYIDNAFFVSFKENINYSHTHYLMASESIEKPNIYKDFRFKKEVKPEWTRMHRHVSYIEVRDVEIIKESNFFKDFGQDHVLGVWDLPSMSITNALSVKKKYLDEIGGFNTLFTGWGMEDTYLGAKLLSNDLYLIPILSSGIYHIEHPPRDGDQEVKFRQFSRNVTTYLSLINKNNC